MKKKFAILILSALLGLKSFGNTIWIPKTQFLDFCYRYKGNLNNITNTSSFLPVYYSNSKKRSNQFVVKDKTGLYILIGATGKVFKATDTLNSKIAFKRIDSTYFEGYNGEAINYSYQNNIYSLGGEGLWRINGQLRIFDTTVHEWNSVKINHEFNFKNRCYNYDNNSSEIFVIQYPYENVITADVENNFYILKLNLLTTNIEKQGLLNKEINISWNYFMSINLNSIEGSNILSLGYSKIYLLDYKNNQIRFLKNELIRKILNGKSNLTNLTNVFELNGKVYYTIDSDPKQIQKSFEIKLSDFSSESIPLYFPEHNYHYLKLAIAGLIIFIIGGLVGWSLFRVKFKKSQKQHSTTIESEPFTASKFTNQEIECIEAIIERIDQGGLPANELIRMVGANKKSEEVQRLLRSNLIKSINQKFSLNNKIDTDFIERVKSDEDKRFMYYTISRANLEVYLNNIKPGKDR